MTKDENDLEKMSLLSHLIELRKRLLTVTIVFLLLFFLYIYRKYLYLNLDHQYL